MFGSGRQALRALLEFGRRTFGWTAAHLPTYYCTPLVDSIADVLPIRRYGCGPLGAERPPAAGPTEVVVAVSYFGAPPVVPAATGAALIIDATHDPLAGWLDRTGADYVFASLRKTLPLPDGGALWSGTGRLLPPDQPPTPDHLAAVGGILSAMCLKAAYLDGADLPKEAYQTLFGTGEEQFAGTGVSGISAYSRTALRVLPAVEFRRLRIHNAATLATALAGLAGIVVRSYSFGVVLECDSHRRREAIRQELVANDVYPAVLWPLPAAGDPSDLPGQDSAARGRLLPPDALPAHRLPLAGVGHASGGGSDPCAGRPPGPAARPTSRCVMLTGRLVGLRPIRAADLDFLADLANAPGVRDQVVGWDWPVARDTQADWLSHALRDPRGRRLTVTDLASGDPVGLTGLWEVDWHNRSALTAVKLMPGATPKGAGIDSIMLMMAWSFYDVGLRRLHSTILEFNRASLGAYVRRCGWRIEGREREAVFRRGQWRDLYRVAVLRSDFDALPNAPEYVDRACGSAPAGPTYPVQPGPAGLFALPRPAEVETGVVTQPGSASA